MRAAVFHWKPHRISAHVSLRVLALLVERIAEIRSGQSWRNARALLDTVKVVEYERGEAVVLQTTRPRDEAEALLRKLKIAALPHHLRSTKPRGGRDPATVLPV